jgi:glycosyltransferase involved in cell wall biosynthesis
MINKNGGGFFYGGKTEYFKKLCDLFYTEIECIYENKLPVPRDLDEFYLGLFRKQYSEQIHLIEMDRQTNTLIFYDNENLDEKIQQLGKRLFMQPYKAEGRANKTIVTDTYNQLQEYIVNLEEQYIFNNYTYDFGRLLKIDETHYRILWSKKPEVREVLDIKTLKINKQPSIKETAQRSPILSIVMPVYNVQPDYLRESIDSILKQSFGDFELLVVDDGSTETQGIDIVKTYKDSRIHLISNPHDFIDSLNKGIRESKGKYIVRMDADDIMLPNRLAVQYEFMEKHSEIDICGSWVELFGSQSTILKKRTEHKEIVVSLLFYNLMAHPTIILRKSSVCKYGTDLYEKEYDCAEDYKLWTVLATKGYQFANIPEVLLKYRCSEHQTPTIRYKEMKRSGSRVQTEYLKEVIVQIERKEERFRELFDNLTTLSNENRINQHQMLSITSQIYKEILNKQENRHINEYMLQEYEDK